MSAAQRAWTATALCALLGGGALAATPLTAEVLRESCEAYAEKPASHAARICASYLQGYLDGALSGAKIVSQPAAGKRAPNPWEARALRTRLGKGYLEALRERQRPYCVADSVAASELLEHLLDYFRANPPGPELTAAEALSRTLRLHYPCDVKAP